MLRPAVFAASLRRASKTLTSIHLLKLLVFRRSNLFANIEDMEDGVNQNTSVPSNRCVVCCWSRVVLAPGHGKAIIVEVLVQ